jgi:hypothetical protein
MRSRTLALTIAGGAAAGVALALARLKHSGARARGDEAGSAGRRRPSCERPPPREADTAAV